MTTLKGAIKSKTIWFSSALVVLGLVESNIHFVEAYLSPEDFGLVVAGIGLATGILRKLTSSSLEDK